MRSIIVNPVMLTAIDRTPSSVSVTLLNSIPKQDLLLRKLAFKSVVFHVIVQQFKIFKKIKF